MSEVRIAGQRRTEFGKGAARRIRRDGNVPAAIYGHGAEPEHISLPGHELMLALKHANVLLSIDIDGEKRLTLPKDVQRHPVTRHLEHVDLIKVVSGEKVEVEVPVVTTGDVAPGGLLDIQLTSVTVSAEATHIPADIEIPITELSVGDAVHAKDLTLPAGVALVTDADAIVAHILPAPTAAQLEAEIGEAPEEKPAEAPVAAPAAEAPREAESGESETPAAE